jgi:Ras-related protein Rab-5C
MEGRVPKVVLLGDASVGKTSLIASFQNDPFTPDTPPTVGVGHFLFEFPESDTGSIKVWDTAGQEDYRSITSLYYRQSQAIIFVFALNAPETLESLTSWITTVNETCAKPPMMLIVGNKFDLRTEGTDDAISFEKGLEFATKERADYIETSAKTGQGVKDVFYRASMLAYRNWDPDAQSTTDSQTAAEERPPDQGCNC